MCQCTDNFKLLYILKVCARAVIHMSKLLVLDTPKISIYQKLRVVIWSISNIVYSGKRINMKKVIQFYASDFRKDKIWLRRKQPDKRQY